MPSSLARFCVRGLPEQGTELYETLGRAIVMHVVVP
jgi:hypothetical protein